MQDSKIHDRLQIAGFVGVIVGLCLVAYEVRQANSIAEAEAVRSTFESWDNIQTAVFQSDFYDIYTKSFDHTENLSPSEVLHMDAWLTANMNQYAKQMIMQKMGLYPYDTVSDLIGNFDFFFGSKFARAWYLENARWWMEPELVDAVDREIERRPIQTAPDLPTRINSRMREGRLTP